MEDRTMKRVGLGLQMMDVGKDDHHIVGAEAGAEPGIPDELLNRRADGSPVTRLDKVRGEVLSLVGRVTRNPAKQVAGEVLKSGNGVAIRGEERMEIE
ncbi:hypothetical protein MNV49_005428 [Pseudohyphozyma bogoriensis]|nr:hypothetical protein MNV49_005428 [Pseudohyphozyma bogoriensis]